MCEEGVVVGVEIEASQSSISWLSSWGRRLPDFVDTNLPAPTPVQVGATAYTFPSGTTTSQPYNDPDHPHTNELIPYTSTTYRSVTGINNSNFAYNVRQLQRAVRFTF